MKINRAMRWCFVIIVGFCCIHGNLRAQSDDASNGWPKEITTSEGVVVIYQPQPEKLEGNILEGRAAVALELTDAAEPVFGVIWISADMLTDRDERTATLTNIKVLNSRFPNEDEQKAAKLGKLLSGDMPKWELTISMDRLVASLEVLEKRAAAAENINTTPPKIIFMPEPAILITIDGEPRLKQEINSEVQRVINTAFTILLEPSDKSYYLYADKDTWYTAKDLEGEWSLASSVPAGIAARAPKDEEPATEGDGELTPPEEETAEPGAPPKVIVSTEPAELISSEGKPEFKPVDGTDLLYVSNTDSDVLMNIETQEYFVLLSGRWYAGTSLEGPWKYISGDDVPEAFAKIPEDSEMGTVLYAVPETEVAKEAVLDAQIPQTATVDRAKAELTVEYDGEPKFEKIKGTSMKYAVNTATPIVLANKFYYACDQAVWFVSSLPTGPWQVASSVPDEIYTIPPDSPIYHITHVRIYSSTPEVVYVGYTSGYTHTYIYHGTIVYGTGYWWPGWYGSYYYPRPATWGFHVRWNPWGGWRFGFSYCNGPFRFTVGGGGWYRGGWWGPRRYRSYRRGYRHGYRRGQQAGYRAGYRAGQRNSTRQNVYKSQKNQARTKPASTAAGNRTRANTAANRNNNVFADKNGNVHRKTDQGWQTQSKDGWKNEGASRPSTSPSQPPTQPSRPATQPSTQPSRPATQPSVQPSRPSTTQQLDRSYQSRQQGTQRTQSYNRSRPSGGRGGGGRGGGGRR